MTPDDDIDTLLREIAEHRRCLITEYQARRHAELGEPIHPEYRNRTFFLFSPWGE